MHVRCKDEVAAEKVVQIEIKLLLREGFKLSDI